MHTSVIVNRLTYGAAAIAAVFALVLFDAWIGDTSSTRWWAELLRHGSLIPLIFGALAVGGAVELCRLMRAAGLRPQTAWAVFCSGLLTLTPWLVSGLVLQWSLSDLDGYQWLLAVLALALLGSVFGALARREMTGALADIGATWTVILYTGLLTSFALQLRSHSYLHGPDGAWLILIFVFVVKVSDIGAWFTGMAIGRHKLIPWVSPGKTIEGALGGMACSALVAFVLWKAHLWTEPQMAPPVVSAIVDGGTPGKNVGEMLMRCKALTHEITRNFHVLTMVQAIIFGILMSFSGQLGDLLESCFKRSAGVKDSASLLPAFGGILDIIDSPLLAAPVAWFLLTCWWPVV